MYKRIAAGLLICLSVLTGCTNAPTVNKKDISQHIVKMEEHTKEKTQESVNENPEESEETALPEGAFSYDGKNWIYNDATQNYLIMGVDKEQLGNSSDMTKGGQADALFLLSLDDSGKRLSVVAINRNTMMDVDVCDAEGNYVSTLPLQICLQYGYGDGKEGSAAKTADAISSFFYDIPIDGYIAVDMDSVVALTDLVGGIVITPDVEIPAGFGYEAIKSGESTILDGRQALWYARYRDTNEFNSVTGRTNRQEEVLAAVCKQVMARINDHSTSIIDVAGTVYPYLTTNMSIPEMTVVASQASNYKENIKWYELSGETVIGDTEHEEFYPDEEEMYRMMLDVFYRVIK